MKVVGYVPRSKKVLQPPADFDPTAGLNKRQLKARAKAVKRLILALQHDDLETALQLLELDPEIIMGTKEHKPLRVAASEFHDVIAEWAAKSYHHHDEQKRAEFKSECLVADGEATQAFQEYHSQGGHLTDPVGKRYRRQQYFLRRVYEFKKPVLKEPKHKKKGKLARKR